MTTALVKILWLKKCQQCHQENDGNPYGGCDKCSITDTQLLSENRRLVKSGGRK
jgi:hypothetical protein